MAATPDNPLNLRCVIIQSTTTNNIFFVPAIDLPSTGYNPSGYQDPSTIPGEFSYLERTDNGWRINYPFPFEIPTIPPPSGAATTTYLLQPYQLPNGIDMPYVEIVVTGTDPVNNNQYWVKTDITNAQWVNSDTPEYPNLLNLRGVIIQSSSNPQQFFYLPVADYPDRWENPLGVSATIAQVAMSGSEQNNFPPQTPDNFTLLTYATGGPIPETALPLSVSYILNPYAMNLPGAATDGSNLPYVVIEIQGTDATTGKPAKVTGSATGRPVVVDPVIPPGNQVGPLRVTGL
jgi:hypothetical protein